MSEAHLLYAWRCEQCGERESVDSYGEAESGATDHRSITGHVALFTIGPEGETPA